MRTKNSLCPVCGKELKVDYDAGHFIIWCQYGPCESLAANNGAVDNTLEKAMSKLLDRINKERGEDQENEIQSPS